MYRRRRHGASAFREAPEGQDVSEVGLLQEVLHRYGAIGRREAIQPAFDVLTEIVDRFCPLEATVLENAKAIVVSTALTARDSFHLAVMKRHRADRIPTFDGDFDDVPDITRLR